MFCESCGKEVKDGTLFCPYCGAKMTPKPQTAPSGQPMGGIMPAFGQSAQPNGGMSYNQGQPMNGGMPPYNQSQPMNGGFGMEQGTPKKKKGHKAAIISCSLVAILAVCGVGGYFGYGYYQEFRLENAIEDGNEAYKEGSFTKAIESYEDAISYDADNKEALEGKKKAELGKSIDDAEALTKAGSYDDAVAAFDKILEAHPDNADAQAGKDAAKKAKLDAQIAADLATAQGYLDKSDYANAVTSFGTVLAEDSDNADAITGMTTAYNAIIDADIAAKDYETALTDAQAALTATSDTSFQTRIDDEISPNIIPEPSDAIAAANKILADATSKDITITNTTKVTVTSKSNGASSELDANVTVGVQNVINDDETIDMYASIGQTLKSGSDTSSDKSELYMDGDGNGYSNEDGAGWEENSDIGLELILFQLLYDDIGSYDFEIKDTTEEVNGMQCYVLTASLSGDEAAYYGRFAEYFLGLSEYEGTDNCTADITLYLTTDTLTPVKEDVTVGGFDLSALSDELNTEAGVTSLTATMDSCTLTIDYNSFNSLTDVTPEGIK